MDPALVAITLLELVVKLVGMEQAKTALSEMEVRFAKAAFEASMLAKFGPTGQGTDSAPSKPVQD